MSERIGRSTKSGAAEREAAQNKPVVQTIPVVDQDVKFYFAALAHTKGVWLRCVVEVKPGDRWTNRDKEDVLPLGSTLISFRGPASEVSKFRTAVAVEKASAALALVQNARAPQRRG